MLSLWGFSDPYEEMRRVQRQMDQLFNSALSTSGTTTSSGDLAPVESRWAPAFDVRETDKDIVIHADLPGVKKEDMTLELQEGRLTISGERKFEKKEENEKYHHLERSYGKFVRTFPVPKTLKEQDIKARVDNGILEISFPKGQQQLLTKSIPIN